MSRWKAAAIHLLISIAIALIIAIIFLKVWYPPPFFSAAGADELMLLLVGMDVTLGPLVTLIIFRSGKRGLKFDLAFIALVQSCSLAYGLSVILESRPVFLVAAIDRFILVFANDFDDQGLAKGHRPEFQHRSWSGPQLAGAVLPSDQDKRSDLAWAASVGVDIERMPEFYVPYADQADSLLTHARSLEVLRSKHPEASPLIEAAARDHQIDVKDLVYLPLVARKHDLSMLVSKQTRLPVQAINVDPW